MVKSMTGYGRANVSMDGINALCEIKSVNHRFFEFSARTPRTYGFLEEKLKSYFQSLVSRGKVECFIQIEALEEDDVVINVNHSVAKGYFEAFNEISERYGIENDISVSTISRFNDIFSIHKLPADEEKIWNVVKSAAEEAVEYFIKMREAEGKRLKDDILLRTETIINIVESVENSSEKIVEEYNAKLYQRLSDLLQDTSIDEQRILTEAAIFADKTAVAEETVRLRSHISQLNDIFESDEPIGRKVDFIVQEMNREANTIGSKVQDVKLQRCVIDIKSEIEKIREQIQNIE